MVSIPMCSEQCPQIRAVHEGKEYTNKISLPEPVTNSIKPVFRDLVHPDLFSKCLSGNAQNANESVKSLVWKLCSKEEKSWFCNWNKAWHGL